MLETLTRPSLFRIDVDDKYISFTPQISGVTRRLAFDSDIEKYLNLYNEGCRRPADYVDMGRNSSYFLAVMAEYEKPQNEVFLAKAEGGGVEATNKTTETEMKTEPENEMNDDDFNLSGKQKIYTSIGDPEVKGLHDKQKRGRLNIQPDFQRQFVWDNKKASHLIESAILGIPLPVVYFSEEPDGKVSVIDGQQRLTAFFSFIDGKFPDGKEFRLSSLKVFKELNRKRFSDLDDEIQEKITECKIRTITFSADSHKDLKFEIFERLNSGSVKLNDQELRNCIYRGRYNNLLREMSTDKTYMKIMGYQKRHKRMLDIEFVLRFASFYHQTYLRYKSPMKKFMNEEMEAYRDISDNEASKLKKAFDNSVSLVFSLLGANAFRRFTVGTEENKNGKWESQQFNAALFDVLMWSFAEQDKNLVMRNLDSIREELIYLMSTNQEFNDSILLATSSTKRVEQRFEIWSASLKRVLQNETKSDRCFSRGLKKEFYDKDPTCAICGGHISGIDDAAMDHKKQYWLGGETVPDNARLTHRYCNNARSRSDGNED